MVLCIIKWVDIYSFFSTLVKDKPKKGGGVTYPTIDNIYKGTSTSIKFEILESICKELSCSLDEILVFDGADLKEQQAKRLLIYSSEINKMQNKGDTSK